MLRDATAIRRRLLFRHRCALPMRVACAWCDTEISAGVEPTSHGICPTCVVRLNPEPVEHAGEDVTNADHGGGLGSGVGSEVNMNPNMEG